MEGKQEHYFVVLEKTRILNKAYQEACLQYRAREIGDEEFLKVREAMVMGQVEFDQAELALKQL